jgi:hypothetical protein
VRTARQQRIRLCRALLVLGLVLIACGVLYYVKPADALPTFFPGYTPGESKDLLPTALFSGLVGFACVIAAGLLTPPKDDPVREVQQRLRQQALRLHERRVAARWDEIDRARREGRAP